MVAFISDPARIKFTAAPPIAPTGEPFDPAHDVVLANTFYSHFVYRALAKAGRFDAVLRLRARALRRHARARRDHALGELRADREPVSRLLGDAGVPALDGGARRRAARAGLRALPLRAAARRSRLRARRVSDASRATCASTGRGAATRSRSRSRFRPARARELVDPPGFTFGARRARARTRQAPARAARRRDGARPDLRGARRPRRSRCTRRCAGFRSCSTTTSST